MQVCIIMRCADSRPRSQEIWKTTSLPVTLVESVTVVGPPITEHVGHETSPRARSVIVKQLRILMVGSNKFAIMKANGPIIGDMQRADLRERFKIRAQDPIRRAKLHPLGFDFSFLHYEGLSAFGNVLYLSAMTS